MTISKQKPGAATPGEQNHLGEEMLTRMVAQMDDHVTMNLTPKVTDTGQQYFIDRIIGSGVMAVTS